MYCRPPNVVHPLLTEPFRAPEAPTSTRAQFYKLSHPFNIAWTAITSLSIHHIQRFIFFHLLPFLRIILSLARAPIYFILSLLGALYRRSRVRRVYAEARTPRPSSRGLPVTVVDTPEMTMINQDQQSIVTSEFIIYRGIGVKSVSLTGHTDMQTHGDRY
jgi:hypothetical protein